MSSRCVSRPGRARARSPGRPPAAPRALVRPSPDAPRPFPQLTGRINKCGVISPRFDVELKDMESWINNLLPSRQFGHLVLSTTFGIMDHDEARRKRTGGKLLGFFY